MKLDGTLEYARHLDANNPLAAFRDKFVLPRGNGAKPTVYLVGNSLGLQPKKAVQYVKEEMDDWGQLAVEGHFEGTRPWKFYQNALCEPLAQTVGAMPSEVIAMNSLTVNLHLLMLSFYRPTKEKFKIAIEANAFPSDRYAVESQLKMHGIVPEEGLLLLHPRSGEDILRTEDIVATLSKHKQSVALLLMGGVNYLTGQAFAMQTLTREAHKLNICVGFDLAHATGNLILRLHDWNVDFAVWCSYKYLNAGPGAIGGAFVHERHANAEGLPRLEGWWGTREETRFQMKPVFEGIPGAKGWQISNPPILSAAPLVASLEIFQQAGMETIRRQGDAMTTYVEQLFESEVANGALQLISPRTLEDRGSQLSFRVKNAKALATELKEAGNIFCDFREPDVLRISTVPLYNTFEDLHSFVTFLRDRWPKKQ